VIPRMMQYGIESFVADRGRPGSRVRRHERLDELETTSSSSSTTGGSTARLGGQTPTAPTEADQPAVLDDRLELSVVVDRMLLSEHASTTRAGRLQTYSQHHPVTTRHCV